MIQANKLRIGNLFNYHDLTVNVVEITKQYAVFAYFEDGIGFSRAYSEYDFPKPIPLTPEWLTRAGFKNFAEYFLLDGFKLEKTDAGLLFCWDGKDVLVQHLHQLQNLYFSLTGTELEFK